MTSAKACLVDPRPLLRFDFGPLHPFKVHRLGLVYGLMKAMGLIEREDVYVIEPREATIDEAKTFHSDGYLEILRVADDGMWVPNLFDHGLGTADNPVFPGVYEWAMTVAGGSIRAAEETIAGRSLVSFSPAGGLHHAMASRASGFCHVNDVVLAIHTLLAAGKRVAYVDIDAHHGDGVQHAFYARKDVLTISIHQSGHTIFPGTGYADEAGVGACEGYAINLPLLPGAGDAAYERCLDEAILPAFERYRPDALVTQLGADALDGDLVAGLAMSLSGFEKIVEQFAMLGLPWVALGGGGYDVGNVVRAWVLAWGVMNHVKLPDAIPDAWLTEAAAYGVSVSSLRGVPSQESKVTPQRVMSALDCEIDRMKARVFPLLEDASADSAVSSNGEPLSERP